MGIHRTGVHEETGLTLIMLLRGNSEAHSPIFLLFGLFYNLSIDIIDYIDYNLFHSAERSGHDEAEPDVYVSYVHALVCVMSTVRT